MRPERDLKARGEAEQVQRVRDVGIEWREEVGKRLGGVVTAKQVWRRICTEEQERPTGMDTT